MMIGMFGVGLLMIILLIGFPVLIILVLAGGTAGILQTRQNNNPAIPNQMSMGTNLIAQSPTRYCAHCGAGLQNGWTHCPQCGAPVQ